MKKMSVKKWRALNTSSLNLSPASSKPFYATEIMPFIYSPLHKDPVLLQQEYVQEQRSIKQVAEKLGCSKEAVRQNLIKNNIQIREACQPHLNPAQPRFGQKVVKGKKTIHMAESRVIVAIQDMRANGMSLRQICSFLTTIGVPTKNRGMKWHPEMVKRVLGRI